MNTMRKVSIQKQTVMMMIYPYPEKLKYSFVVCYLFYPWCR